MTGFGVDTRQVSCIRITVGVSVPDIEQVNEVVSVFEAHEVAP